MSNKILKYFTIFQGNSPCFCILTFLSNKLALAHQGVAVQRSSRGFLAQRRTSPGSSPRQLSGKASNDDDGHNHEDNHDHGDDHDDHVGTILIVAAAKVLPRQRRFGSHPPEYSTPTRYSTNLPRTAFSCTTMFSLNQKQKYCKGLLLLGPCEYFLLQGSSKNGIL